MNGRNLVEQIRAAIDADEREARHAVDLLGDEFRIGQQALRSAIGHREILDEHSDIRYWKFGNQYACGTCDYDREEERWHDEPYCPTLAALARIYRIDVPQ